ncbi:hypothetical protein A3G55_04075 [Candidatus Giovannonibacteria bacterium RIFCSPLOWO2_12_FULL_44_25]|uniref:Pyruvate dehydrogenase complex, E2 component, dihydrolipoamide acetyltransferase n=4 Tax=Parcubacteria group TaxID=1794811 RepID=A0A837IGR1_9BACT|nr:MAG: Pyruvate dehydrogenase complex, E2 component, dihydrolipoamide acetyltransferase [Parcubacteria group bacterium GW2011_GWC1_44_10]KKT56995.1 MAG: Pyruvate dehydrogenase complex, E2 component, dihydrolipoamide acetyltransferase [Candidatus Giovannonibacteria bacterium GW2011_GWB1_44_23]KKT59606.1 MAG: Pyruvate dehydrogenase complex, E2 component, dihydrolipoamide acetyltransferase [Candidatus Giovannonibacteria bacterium GW2011_GWA1_44_25]KKU12512.1 MAG: Pyruvate dehydrogenase complex, E2
MSLVEIHVTFQTFEEEKTEAKFKVLDILVSVGQFVRKEDGLVTIETEKATFDFESPVEGSIKEIFLKEDPAQEYSHGTLFCTIEASP